MNDFTEILSKITVPLFAVNRRQMKIQIKRVYERAARSDGRRYLVDRLWPRGIRKEVLSLAGWCQAAAPSDELRKWFQHDAAKWKEFQRRYRAELTDKPDT